MSTTRQAEAHRADVVEPTGRRVGEHGRMGEIVEVLSAPEDPPAGSSTGKEPDR